MKLFQERSKSVVPCPIGADALCCKNCFIGPCRFVGSAKGVCGANKELVMARNLLRMAAGGAAAHCGHSIHILEYINKPWPKDYVEKNAPAYLQKLWKKLGIFPKSPMREISQALHQTAFGVDSDWRNVLLSALKMGIVDGYYGLYLSTELEDKVLKAPRPNLGAMSLGVISKDKPNIAVHGHDPLLPAKIIECKKDCNVIGVCCTGAELLARYGIPLAANISFSEQVIATGAIESMVVDIQCIMPSLADIASCYHTKLVTTQDIAHMPGEVFIPFSRDTADSAARKIVRLSEDNFKNRREVTIPNEKINIWSGWTPNNMPLSEIKEDLKNGKIKGVVAFIGCTNPRVDLAKWVELARKLMENHYLILTTGCIAYEFGKKGLLSEKGKIYHLGSCVNNARVAEVMLRLAKGKLTDENFLVSCPAPITEKALAIGLFFTSLGISTHYGFSFLSKNAEVCNFLGTALKEEFNSKLFIEENPEKLWQEIRKGV